MMINRTFIATSSRSKASTKSSPFMLDKSARPRDQEPQVLACLDDDVNRLEVVKHAQALSEALGLRLGFAQIVETAPHGAFPADPIDWNLHFAECREEIRHLAQSELQPASNVHSVILPGFADERLDAWAEDHRGSVLVLARHSGRKPHPGLGSTVERLLHSGSASIMLIPPREDSACSSGYRKLLVPLDGSPNSESVLPIVARISRACDALVILAHIAPPEDNLPPLSKEQIHGGSSAKHPVQSYLETWTSRLVRQQVNATHYFEFGDNPIEALGETVSKLGVDLIVLSSHGQSNVLSAPFGSVAGGLATVSSIPLLMVRPNLQIPLGDNMALSEMSGIIAPTDKIVR